MSDGECFEPKVIGFLCNWCAYAGGDKFATVIREMIEEIKKLGPNPLKVGGRS